MPINPFPPGTDLSSEPAEDTTADFYEDARSNMPYGKFTGNGARDPRGEVGSGFLGMDRVPSGASVITNGVVWYDDGSVYDLDSVRSVADDQEEDC